MECFVTGATGFIGSHVAAALLDRGDTVTGLTSTRANVRVLSRLDRLVNYKTLNRWQLWLGHRLLPGISGVQRLVEDAPTMPHDEFVKIAGATARFPKIDINFSKVTAPTLILHGEHLPTANEETTRRLVGQLSNTDPTVRVVPGSRHASNLDNPEFFTTLLRKFLTRIHPAQSLSISLER